MRDGLRAVGRRRVGEEFLEHGRWTGDFGVAAVNIGRAEAFVSPSATRAPPCRELVLRRRPGVDRDDRP
ncbi:MAG TPA: hypothetical protein VK446_11605, partial [Methylocystis sp.]|nr:hypothetical protein [Methylocystis sp.]